MALIRSIGAEKLGNAFEPFATPFPPMAQNHTTCLTRVRVHADYDGKRPGSAGLLPAWDSGYTGIIRGPGLMNHYRSGEATKTGLVMGAELLFLTTGRALDGSMAAGAGCIGWLWKASHAGLVA